MKARMGNEGFEAQNVKGLGFRGPVVFVDCVAPVAHSRPVSRTTQL